MVVLDSSAAIHILGGTSTGSKIKEVMSGMFPQTTAMTVNEVMIGVREKEKNLVQDFFQGLEVLPFDEKAAYKSVEIEKSLKLKGKSIGKLDTFIAAVCISRNLELITTDADFKKVDELKTIVIATATKKS